MNKKKSSSRTRNSVLNLLTGIGGHLLLTLLNFVVRTVFIQTLGVSFLGIGGLFSNILQMLSLTQLGMDTAINFKLYKPLSIPDEKRVRVLMKFYKIAYRIIGCVILLLGLLLIPTLPYLIKDYESLNVLKVDAALVFMLYLLQSVSSYLFFAYRTTIIQTAQKSYILNIVDFFINIFQSITQIVILFVWGDFMLYVASVVLFNFIRNGVNALIAEKMFKYAFLAEKDSLSRAEIKEIFKDCMALFLYKINSVVLKATDNIILSSFIGLTIVGLYANYLLFYNAIKRFLNQIYLSVKASFGNLYATATLERSYFMFEVMNFLTIILYGTALVGIAVCGNETITVWIGEKFTIPQPFPILIGVELLTSGLKNNLGQVRNISGAFRQMWFRPLLGIIINLSVSIIAVQYYGIFGVIIGTITADILTNFMVDPAVIHKYSFKGLKPTFYYYSKNIKYLGVLVFVLLLDFYICSIELPFSPFIRLVLHLLISIISVPLIFLSLYWRTEICKYLLKKALKKHV